jgi:hypothetical protein
MRVGGVVQRKKREDGMTTGSGRSGNLEQRSVCSARVMGNDLALSVAVCGDWSRAKVLSPSQSYPHQGTDWAK